MNTGKVRNLFFVLIALFLLPNIKVEAASTCTTQEKNNLIQLAYNIKIDYELSDYRSRIDKKRDYIITFSNVPQELYAEYNSMAYYYNTNKTTPGIIKFDEAFAPNTTFSFKIYASNKTKCKDSYIATRTITLPAYNVYSELELCDEYPNFKLCDKNYNKDISDEEFFAELEKYKNQTDTTTTPTKKEEKKKSTIDNIIDIYLDNLIISISITALVIAIIVILIVRYRKKQVKIKL